MAAAAATAAAFPPSGPPSLKGCSSRGAAPNPDRDARTAAAVAVAEQGSTGEPPPPQPSSFRLPSPWPPLPPPPPPASPLPRPPWSSARRNLLICSSAKEADPPPPPPPPPPPLPAPPPPPPFSLTCSEMQQAQGKEEGHPVTVGNPSSCSPDLIQPAAPPIHFISRRKRCSSMLRRHALSSPPQPRAYPTIPLPPLLPAGRGHPPWPWPSAPPPSRGSRWPHWRKMEKCGEEKGWDMNFESGDGIRNGTTRWALANG